MQTALMILVVPLGILALLLTFGAMYQAVGTARDRRRFPPPGRLVRVNKRLMHIHAPWRLLRFRKSRRVLETG